MESKTLILAAVAVAGLVIWQRQADADREERQRERDEARRDKDEERADSPWGVVKELGKEALEQSGSLLREYLRDKRRESSNDAADVYPGAGDYDGPAVD